MQLLHSRAIQTTETCSTVSFPENIVQKSILSCLIVVTLVAIQLIATASPAEASHFRAGTLMWEDAGGNDVNFKMTSAWRKTFFDSSCPGGTCEIGETFSPGSLSTGAGSITLNFLITALYEDGDWIFGEAYDGVTTDTLIPESYGGSGNQTASFSSCCRLGGGAGHINNPAGDYLIGSTVNVGSGNSSPVASMPPVVGCPINALCQFTIPGSDPDGDDIRYRMAAGAEWSSLTQPAGATIDPDSGVYNWDTTGAVTDDPDTYYSTQVIVEDLDATGDVISKIPVDFFIKLIEGPPNPAPTWISPTPPCGSMITADVGVELAFSIGASDDATADVSIQAIGFPVGATSDPVWPAIGNPTLANISWTPTSADVGLTPVTFTATDSQFGQSLCALTFNVPAGDTTPPTTTLTTTPGSPDGDNGWFVTIPKVTLTSNEAGTTQYQWGVTTGAWTTYGVSFDASYGANTLFYRSIDASGNTEDAMSQVIYRDDAPPIRPTTVTSTSHVVSVWSPDNTVDVTWDAGAVGASGLAGYSILWDTNPSGTPDATPDTLTLLDTSPPLADGSNHYFHVTTCNNAGVCVGLPRDIGPFQIDTSAPTNPASITSPSHTVNVWSPDDTVDVTWDAGSDSDSGVAGYSILWDTTAVSTPDATPDTASTNTTSPNLADGSSHYMHLLTCDNVGNCSGPKHIGPFRIDDSDPINPVLSSPGHTTSDPSNDNTIQIDWAGADGALSGINGYSHSFTAGATGDPDGTTDDAGGASTTTSGALADGIWYFNLTTIDEAGNSTDAVHIGPFNIDTVAPISTLTTDPPSPDGDNGWFVSPTKVIVVSNETGSTDYQWGVTTGAWTTYGVSFDAVYGENTVYYRSVDIASNFESPQSYDFKVDTVIPTNPGSLSSPSHTVSVWSTDDTVDVNWPAGSAGASGVSGYSILWDTTAVSTPDATPDTTSTFNTSPALADGASHYVHLRTCNNGGVCSAPMHMGPFQTDSSSPVNPGSMTSTSHIVNVWSPDDTVDVTWDAGTAASGVAGYSILWDTSPATVPDATPDTAGLSDTSPNLADGASHYAHLRTCNTLGVCSGAIHLGPFKIDDSIPTNPGSMTSTSHTVNVWSPDDTVDVTWDAGAAGASGVAGYSILWDTSPATTPDATPDTASLSTTSSPLANGSSHYVHLRTCNNAGVCSGPIHLGPFKIDDVAPSSASPTSTSHSVGVWSPDNTVDVTWDAGIAGPSGVAGFSVLWDTSPATVPDSTPDTASLSMTSPSLADGAAHYFHISTCNNAGVCGLVAHLGPFQIDSSIPTNPGSLTSPSHTVNVWSPDDTVDVTWDAGAAGASGLAGYSILWDTSPATTPDATPDTAGLATTSPNLADGGSHYMHLSTCNNAGTCSAPIHIGPFKIDDAVPTPPSSLSSPTHTVDIWTPDGTIPIEFLAGSAGASGVAGYSVLWDTSSTTTPDSIVETTSLNLSSPSLADGASHWVHIVTCNNAGVCSAPVHLGPFKIDSSIPTNPGSLTSPSHTVNVWSPDDTVDVTWDAGAAGVSGLAGYSILWDTSPATAPDATPDTASLANTSAALANGGSHYMHLTTCNNAGTCAAPIHIGPFKIDDAVPTNSASLTSSSHTVDVWSYDDSVDVTWDAGSAGGSGLAGYSFVWDTTPDTTPDSTVDTTALEITSPDLSDGASHWFHLVTCNNIGVCSAPIHIGPFKIDTSSVSIYPNANEIPYGKWTKLAGSVKDGSGDPAPNTALYLQYWNGSSWVWLGSTRSSGSGYYQYWTYSEEARTYRAMHVSTGKLSNKTTVTLQEYISIWNNYRPKTRDCQWSKVHGTYGGPLGKMAFATLYLQKWTGYSWSWLATVQTDANGYYKAWMEVCPDTKIRMATAGSRLTSDSVTKQGSYIIAWEHIRAHAVLRDGYDDPVEGRKLHLQSWDGTKWVWEETCRTSATGYCHFHQPWGTTPLRVATDGSKVVSTKHVK